MNLMLDERKECENQLKKLQNESSQLKKEYEMKCGDNGKRDQKASNVEKEVEMREKKIETLTDILNQKDDILREIEEKIRKSGGEGLAQSMYSAFKGDLVDELLAKYINMTQCPVPIKRLGNGYYLFGSKKIFAKIMNGKLVIRVGGGFMVIEEFIATYSDAEMKKIQTMEARELEEETGSVSGKSKGYMSNKRSPRAGSGGGISAGSPRNDNFGKKAQDNKGQ